MTTALTFLDAISAAEGGRNRLVAALFPDDPKGEELRRWQALRQAGRSGNLPRYLEVRFRALAALHDLDVPPEAFLTKRQIAEREAAKATAA